MSMFSEIAAGTHAAELEKILFEAVNGKYWSDTRSAIKGFCKVHIWPLYKQAVGDSYGLHDINKELEKIFES